MLFKPKWLRNIATFPSIALSERPIAFVERYNYLGHNLSSDLHDDMDISEQVRKLYTVGNALIRKFNFCADNVKCELFRAYCNSLYCSALWCKFKHVTVRKLKVCHNGILRRLLDISLPYSASDMFVQHRLRDLDALLRNSMFSLRSRLHESNNCLIMAIIAWTHYGQNPLHKHWMKCLYVSN